MRVRRTYIVSPTLFVLTIDAPAVSVELPDLETLIAESASAGGATDGSENVQVSLHILCLT